MRYLTASILVVAFLLIGQLGFGLLDDIANLIVSGPETDINQTPDDAEQEIAELKNEATSAPVQSPVNYIKKTYKAATNSVVSPIVTDTINDLAVTETPDLADLTLIEDETASSSQVLGFEVEPDAEGSVVRDSIVINNGGGGDNSASESQAGDKGSVVGGGLPVSPGLSPGIGGASTQTQSMAPAMQAN